MFEATLQAQLKAIFDFEKVVFDKPSESQEQEGVFVDITKSKCKIKDKRQIATVNGVIHVFANLDKLPFGYFSKCIDAASAELKEGFFFYDLEESKGTYRNIVERSLSFVYLFDSQYDPNVGSITSINLSYSES